jgi:intracellular septation protein
MAETIRADNGNTEQSMSDRENMAPHEPRVDKRQLVKLAIEIGPLIAFLIAYSKTEIITATGFLIIATLLSLVASRIFLDHIATMPIVTAVLVTVFGGLTMWLQDPSFIKMKPTVLYVLFAAILAGGLFWDKLFIKFLFGEAFNLTEIGWKKLTVRWALFFLFLAALNEVIWRNFSEQAWVKFKVFGFLPLTMAFAVAQIGLIKRHDSSNKPS